MVTLTIDGQKVTVEEGTYVINAAEAVGIKIPRFCSHKKLDPEANCRICLVDIEGARKLMTSCSTPVTEGMVVNTASEAAIQGREEVMATILASHPLDCPVCDQGGECDLQDFAELNSPTEGKFYDVKNSFKKGQLSPLIEKELNRCVTCLRCVRYCAEYMDVGALAAANRGNHTEITTFMGRDLVCEFCGGCIEICPVGALTNKTVMYMYRPWQLEKHQSICPYCADGCTMTLHTRDEKIIRTTYDWENGRNQGSLCAKGYFGLLSAEGRLLKPLAKKHKKLVEVSWDLASREVAKQLKAIKTKHGPDAVAGIISGRCANEDIYLFQKFFREVIGTNNIDSTLRYGPVNSMKAAARVLGTHAMMNDFEEIEGADNIVIIGSDLTETNPVVGYKVKAAVKRYGAKLVVIDSVRSNIAKLAHMPVITDEPLDQVVIALTALLVETGSVKLTAVKQQLSSVNPAISIQVKEQLAEIAQLLSRPEKTVILVGQKIAEGECGYDNCLNIIDMAIMSGVVGRIGSGVNFLYEETNAQGLAMFGAGPDFLPGFKPVAEGKGKDFFEIIDAILEGKIKALIIAGENPVVKLPSLQKLKEALSKLDLLVVHDTMLNETVEMADYIFPVAGFGEKDGSFTNVEGKVQTFPKVCETLGDGLPDWQIIAKLAKAMGSPMEYADTEDLRNEMMEEVEKADVNYAESIDSYTRSLSSEELNRRYAAKPSDGAKRDNGFELVLGPVLFQSGRLTTYSKTLSEVVEFPKLRMNSARLTMNKKDAIQLQVNDGDKVKVSTGLGSVEVEVVLSQKYPEGVVFFPEHYSRPALAGIIEVRHAGEHNSACFKNCSVAIEKI